MNGLIPVIFVFAGVIAGAMIVWLLLRGQSQRSYEQGKADNGTHVAALQERLTARDTELQKLHQSIDREVSQRDQMREENAGLRAQLEGERRAAQERSESFKQAAGELSEKFKALSRDALKD